MSDSDNIPASIAQEPEELKAKRERSTLSKVLPTDRIAFHKQVDILRAFAAVYAANDGKAVATEQAGEILSPKFSGSTITQGISFFCDIGLLVRTDKGGFVPSQELIDYNNACQWDEAEARLKLRPIFEKTWFYRCLVPRLQLAPQTQATCLALFANESKALPDHQERLVNLLGFLELSGIVSITGGTVGLLQHKTTDRTSSLEPEKPKLEPKSPAPLSFEDEHILYLDKDRKRKVTLCAPLEISKPEYDRICKWIEVVLIVEKSTTPP